MSKVSFEFEHEVGAVLTHRDADISSTYPPVAKFVVVERTAQQCHGGTQGFYRVRAMSPEGNVATALFDLPYFEVRAYPTTEEIDAAAEKSNHQKIVAQKRKREAQDALIESAQSALKKS